MSRCLCLVGLGGCSHTRCLVQDPATCTPEQLLAVGVGAAPWAEKHFFCSSLDLSLKNRHQDGQQSCAAHGKSFAWEIRKRRRQPVNRWDTEGLGQMGSKRKWWGYMGVIFVCVYMYIHTYKYMHMFCIYIWRGMAQDWIEAEEDGESQSPSKTFTYASKTKEGSVSLQDHLTSTESKKCKEILHKILWHNYFLF